MIGVPLVSDSPLYLLRWFYSIDIPVQHIVVVSGGNNVFVKAEIAHIADQVSKKLVCILVVSHKWVVHNVRLLFHFYPLRPSISNHQNMQNLWFL